MASTVPEHSFSTSLSFILVLKFDCHMIVGVKLGGGPFNYSSSLNALDNCLV